MRAWLLQFTSESSAVDCAGQLVRYASPRALSEGVSAFAHALPFDVPKARTPSPSLCLKIL